MAIIRGVIGKYSQKHNVYSRLRLPPVGIMSVLSQIADKYGVHAIDENNYGERNDDNNLPDHAHLQEIDPVKIVLLYGGMTNSIPRIFDLARQYKKMGVITVVGGNHVDAMPEEALRQGVDVVVHGEGEQIIQDLVPALLEGKDLENIVGLSFIKDGNMIFTGRRDPIENLDSLIDTDLDLFKYTAKRWSSIPVNMGRGCNYCCEFCVVNDQLGKYRRSSPEKTFRQVKKHAEQGYKSFFITDDNFAQNPEAAIELCKKIGDYKRAEKKKINLIAQVRTEAAKDDRLIDAMRYAGIMTLCIGYESPINEELSAMKKGVTVEMMLQRSRKLSKDFLIHCMMIFDYPVLKDSKYKTLISLKEKAKRYKKFIKDSKITTLQLFNTVPIPGTKLRRKLEEEDRILSLEYVNWDKYDGMFLCHKPDEFDPYEAQHTPKEILSWKYRGGFFNRNFNQYNWINWANNFTFGYIINHIVAFGKRMAENSKNPGSLMHQRNLFVDSWEAAKADVKRKIKALKLNTGAAFILNGWQEEYNKIEFDSILQLMKDRTI